MLSSIDWEIVKDEKIGLEKIKNYNVIGLISNKRIAANLFAKASKLNKYIIGIEHDDKYYSFLNGKRMEVGINLLKYNECRFSFAEELGRFHGNDTPISVGFQGNWFGTYGLLILRQDKDLNVFGKYWYGNGEISGKCNLNFEEKRLVLEYHWNQKKNNSDIGSQNNGIGRFTLPLGKEYIFGYWRDLERGSIPQNWNASRCSKDLTDDLKKNANSFGSVKLSKEMLSEIIEWKN